MTERAGKKAKTTEVHSRTIMSAVIWTKPKSLCEARRLQQVEREETRPTLSGHFIRCNSSTAC